jgi:hypothetical protein
MTFGGWCLWFGVGFGDISDGCRFLGFKNKILRVKLYLKWLGSPGILCIMFSGGLFARRLLVDVWVV